MKQTKHFTKYILVLVMAGVLLGSGLQIAKASKDTATRTIPANFSELAEKARPGVVNIRTVKTMKGGGPVFRHFFGNPFGDKNPFEHFFWPLPKGGGLSRFQTTEFGIGIHH